MGGRRLGRLRGRLNAVVALSALALSSLLAVSGPATVASAGSPPPTPTVATVSAASGDVVTSPVTGTSKPPVITAVGHSVTVTVSLWATSALDTAAAFTRDTDVTLVSGGVSVTRTFTAGLTSQTFSTADFTTAVNHASVTVSFPTLKGKNTIAPASSPTVFDVLRSVTSDSAGPGYSRSVGADGGPCALVDPQHPYCATVVLPNGAGSGVGDVVLGTGACDSTTYTRCDASSSYVFELLADLSGYSTTSPATVILTCDKAYCGNGPIKANVPSFTISGIGDLQAVPACTAKGVAPASGACVDYVQSTRDNAGDTHLWLLFATDARMSCC